MNGTGHVLVVGVDGVRFDLLGPDSTPSIRALGQQGFLAPVGTPRSPQRIRLSYADGATCRGGRWFRRFPPGGRGGV